MNDKVSALTPDEVLPKELVQPITPQEAARKRLDSFEPEMITAVNNLIIKNLDSSRRSASFKQEDVIKEYFKVKGVEETEKLRHSLFDRHQLDFEPIFRKAGWSVMFDKPGYNESYEAYFKFEKKKKVVEDNDD